MLLFVRTAAVLFVLGASPALACPNPEEMANPYFGEITLSLDYDLDPFMMTVRGGGVTNLRVCGLEGEGLTGYNGDGLIAPRPDVVLHWKVGFQRLAVTTEIEDDALLLIRDPEGRWHFNDDGRGLNPLVVFDDPSPGDYLIYIGGHDFGEPTRPGMLIITETGP